ncbi:uncharacterized protein LOC113366141 [Ctenocephalides felis]|uniref:uncharacterized protein LOC113366141 n=1 Tax=Ctenocephalides felis TaxID=7515 RepID=UPI000E6E58FD|nr:uncharacterized protein LOC113366141 [Ctenocephalides felis]
MALFFLNCLGVFNDIRYWDLLINSIIAITEKCQAECEALRDVRVSVPTAVRRGDSLTLRCLYDIEDDNLYSIKWYKDRREFYRFTPKENPSMKVFPIHGINVDRSRSNDSQLVLTAVESTVTGQYSCEVTADAPSFHTYLVGGDVEVVETPRHNPIITGIKPRYKIGDIMRGNCTSKHSRPPANITWQINGHSGEKAHPKRAFVRKARAAKERNDYAFFTCSCFPSLGDFWF